MPAVPLSDVLAQHRVFIGTITPSSNTVVERVTLGVLRDFPSVSAHFSRISVVGEHDPLPDRYDLDGMLNAARLLSHANLDILVWNGSKGITIGIDHDRELCHQIEAETGIKTTTSVLGLERVLQAWGVQRIGVVTPYSKAYQDKTIAALEQQGYICVAEAHSGLADNYSYSQVLPAAITTMLRQVAAGKPDAIITVCTNFPAAPLAGTLEQELGIPIFDTTSLGVWQALKQTGIDTSPGQAWGSVFAS